MREEPAGYSCCPQTGDRSPAVIMPAGSRTGDRLNTGWPIQSA